MYIVIHYILTFLRRAMLINILKYKILKMGPHLTKFDFYSYNSFLCKIWVATQVKLVMWSQLELSLCLSLFLILLTCLLRILWPLSAQNKLKLSWVISSKKFSVFCNIYHTQTYNKPFLYDYLSRYFLQVMYPMCIVIR